jgi:mRNA-degrading endonuclease RelE of RelBE toxin-antitoxin system
LLNYEEIGQKRPVQKLRIGNFVILVEAREFGKPETYRDTSRILRISRNEEIGQKRPVQKLRIGNFVILVEVEAREFGKPETYRDTSRILRISRNEEIGQKRKVPPNTCSARAYTAPQHPG